MISHKAFNNAFSKDHILKAFEKTGIAPFNSQAFIEDDYAPSTVMIPLVTKDQETTRQKVTSVDEL